MLYFKTLGWLISSRRSNGTREQNSGLGLSPGHSKIENLELSQRKLRKAARQEDTAWDLGTKNTGVEH